MDSRPSSFVRSDTNDTLTTEHFDNELHHDESKASKCTSLNTNAVTKDDQTNESTPDTPTTLTPTFTREHSISPCSTVHCDDTNQLTHKSSPSQEAPTETIYHDSKTSIRILCAYFALFVFGWGDGVTGTILPYIKLDFNLSYTTSALLFVTSMVGFITGIITIGYTLSWLSRVSLSSLKHALCSLKLRPNREKMDPIVNSHPRNSPSQAQCILLVAASILHASFFVWMGSGLGFKVILAAYAISAFARANVFAILNNYVAAAPKAPLGQLYAIWAFGAFVAPFVCQSLLAKGVAWRFFYLGSLALSVLNTSFITYAFWPSVEERSMEMQDTLGCDVKSSPEGVGNASVRMTNSKKAQNRRPVDSGLKAVLSYKIVWAYCIFASIYCGDEMTTHSYMITYLLVIRGANPKTVGYVTSGFWAGMIISRFAIGVLSTRLSFTQRKRIVHVMLACALVMNLLICLVDSAIENSVSTAFIGFVFGPIYPLVLALVSDSLPLEVRMSTLSIVPGFANIGSSIFPFLAGLLANTYGARVVAYVLIAKTSVLVLIWFFFPSMPPIRTKAVSGNTREKP